MGVSDYQPEKLVRGMYGERPDTPPIEQGNDIDAPFETGSQAVGIPADLLDIIHQPPSRDAEPESEPVKGPIDVDAVNDANPNSRFRVVDVPVLAPGTCVLCKSPGGDGRQFIDLSIQVTWVGALYFCTECITEAARLIGLGPNTWDLASKNLHAELSEMDDRYVETKVKLDAAWVLLRNCHCNDPIVDGDGSIPDAVVVEDSEPAESSDDSNGESGSVEESGDVPEFASYDELVEQQSSPPKSRRRTSKPTE